MLTAEKLLVFDFIRQAYVLNHKGCEFAFISVSPEISYDSCKQVVKKAFPTLELSILDYLPLNEAGQIDHDFLLRRISLVSDQTVEQQVRKTFFELPALSIERKFITDVEVFKLDEKKKEVVTSQDNQYREEVIRVSTSSYAKGEKGAVVMTRPVNLFAALQATAKNHSQNGVTYIDQSGKSRFTSYADLLLIAKRIAHYMEKQALGVGQNLILVFDDHDLFFQSLWAAIIQGIVPISITLPVKLHSASAGSEKLYNTWKLLGKPKVLTTVNKRSDLDRLVLLYDDLDLALLFYEDAIQSCSTAQETAVIQMNPNAPVFYQLTSGSTGLPKCIIEKHSNIIEHVIGSAEFNHYSNDDVSLNWIPVDHVVPVITYHFRDVILGCNQIHVATSYIVNDPLNWFLLIDRYQVSVTWSPNFGYKLLVNAWHESDLDKFGLKSIRYFMNAGEQVTPMVMRDFAQLLAKKGIPSGVIQPSFGMAEVATCMTYNNQFTSAHSILRVKQTSVQAPFALARILHEPNVKAA